MPFKFGLGKARRYNVSSKSAYVVCVHMLDNSLIECTLTADGTGHDCLQNIGQRIDLHEVAYFGLRYVNKKLQFRWLDLDRPLKCQLDKHAHSPLLYFRVMFFIADVASIRDTTARHQLYLQLKMDVVEGKYPCTNTQAVTLAAYCLQVEHGSRPVDAATLRATPGGVLPRTTDERTSNALWDDILIAYANLRSMTPEMAEFQYIVECQQLEDYGLEYYPAKDDHGREILLGASFVGIFVKRLDGKPANYYPWADIHHLSTGGGRRGATFRVETALSDRGSHFTMEDADMVKYVFKMCSVQHKFYYARQHMVTPVKGADKSPAVGPRAETSAGGTDGSVGPLPDIQQSVLHAQPEVEPLEPCNDSVDYSAAYTAPAPPHGNPENYYENAQVLLDQHHTPDPASHNMHYTTGSPGTPYTEIEDTVPEFPPMLEETVPEFPQLMDDSVPDYPPGDYPPGDYPPGLEETVPEYPPVQLPAYRAAPNYESIMRRRMDFLMQQQQQQQQHESQYRDLSLQQSHAMEEPAAYRDLSVFLPNIAKSQVYSHPELLTYSQPEMRHHHAAALSRYNNMAANANMAANMAVANMAATAVGQTYYPDTVAGRPVDRSHSLNIHPGAGHSTPELRPVQRLHTVTAVDFPRPPPPPPYPRGSSTSFPDLASLTAPAPAATAALAELSRMRKHSGGAGAALLHHSLDNLHNHIQISRQNSAQQQPEREVFITEPPFSLPPTTGDTYTHSQYYTENPYENLPPAIYSNKMLSSPEHGHKMPPSPENQTKMAASLESQNKMAASPESQNKMAASPEDQNKMAASPESQNKMATDYIECLDMSKLSELSDHSHNSSNMSGEQSQPKGINISQDSQTLNTSGVSSNLNSSNGLRKDSSGSLRKNSVDGLHSNALVLNSSVERTRTELDKLNLNTSSNDAVDNHDSTVVETDVDNARNADINHNRETDKQALKDTETSLLDKVVLHSEELDTDSDDILSKIVPVVSKQPKPNETANKKPAPKLLELNFNEAPKKKTRPVSAYDPDAAPYLQTAKKKRPHSHYDLLSDDAGDDSAASAGPLKMAALNGLSLSRGSILELSCDDERAPQDERRRELEARLADGQVFVEFEQIEKKSSGASGRCSVGSRPEHAALNRFRDVLPYDETRVRLRAPPRDNPAGYVNASYVTVPIAPGRPPATYIATQAPTERTVAHFWQLVWEQDVAVVAMLTALTDEMTGAAKCAPYWPQRRGEVVKVTPELQVSLAFPALDSGSYVTSTLWLAHAPSRRRRRVFHLRYTAWPDHGCPTDTWTFQAFLDELDAVCRSVAPDAVSAETPAPPLLVHCSAGVGRTGVLILAQVMRSRLEHGAGADVSGVLGHMRRHRMHLVQTAAQYTFVYRCLVDFLKSARLI